MLGKKAGTISGEAVVQERFKAEGCLSLFWISAHCISELGYERKESKVKRRMEMGEGERAKKIESMMLVLNPREAHPDSVPP